MHLRNAPTSLMKELDYGKGYRYAHNEQKAYAAGENYLPEELADKQYYFPTDNGLEKQISDKLAHLRLTRQHKIRKTIMHWLAVAIGGALGAMARYGVSSWIFNPSSHKFPCATMSVNVLGSFVMGMLFVIIVEKGALPRRNAQPVDDRFPRCIHNLLNILA